ARPGVPRGTAVAHFMPTALTAGARHPHRGVRGRRPEYSGTSPFFGGADPRTPHRGTFLSPGSITRDHHGRRTPRHALRQFRASPIGKPPVPRLKAPATGNANVSIRPGAQPARRLSTCGGATRRAPGEDVYGQGCNGRARAGIILFRARSERRL